MAVETLALLMLLGIGSNLDNIGVGLSYGLRNVRIPHLQNAVINGIGFLFAGAGAAAGHFLGAFAAPHAAGWISAFIFCSLGLAAVVRTIRSPREAIPHPSDPARSGRSIGSWETVLLGLALSATNAASGTGAGVSGIGALPAGIAIGLWGYLCLWWGNAWSRSKAAAFLRRHGGWASGLLLILVGLHQSIA
ncbi:MAG: manganese efflux pump [Alicyclobacillaceae bacterium]|nr:manganese efflux pump [Alicyclobacillaceae bacterium]